MDSGSGWLVTEGGAWVPVAYNASIEEELPFRRASFVSHAGVRATAARGRGPRRWLVEETVPLDWGQAVLDLYSSATADSPLFWISPLAAGTNIAPPFMRGGKLMTESEITVSDGVSSVEQVLSNSGLMAVSEPFPVRGDARFEFGGFVGGGYVGLQCSTSLRGAPWSSVGITSAPPNGGGLVSSVVDMSSRPGMAYGRLVAPGATVRAASLYARLADRAFTGARPGGPGGSWVTLEFAEVKHQKVWGSSPMVTVSFELVEVGGTP